MSLSRTGTCPAMWQLECDLHLGGGWRLRGRVAEGQFQKVVAKAVIGGWESGWRATDG